MKRYLLSILVVFKEVYDYRQFVAVEIARVSSIVVLFPVSISCRFPCVLVATKELAQAPVDL